MNFESGQKLANGNDTQHESANQKFPTEEAELHCSDL